MNELKFFLKKNPSSYYPTFNFLAFNHLTTIKILVVTFGRSWAHFLSSLSVLRPGVVVRLVLRWFWRCGREQPRKASLARYARYGSCHGGHASQTPDNSWLKMNGGTWSQVTLPHQTATQMKVERAVRPYLTRRVLADPWPSAPSLIQRNERRGEEDGEGKEGLGREDFCNQEG